MKKLILLLIILAYAVSMFAQDYNIRGRVVSQTNTPVEYANVILTTSDSAFVTGGISDQRGRFLMENVKNGIYILQIYERKFKIVRYFILI